ncbi:DnaB-like replicative helicase [Pseudomonas phage Noxifer]|uniref:Helicase n=1 Tax=Pseudomonas phage Noxifer TaxID=2006684 RepID=A0A1Y0T0H0_9CAUD|nr:DnaB-like replicative helicase [Pseudomonas phage Noxifer]ARV77289.1 helicase [Pseudomonas phage Noxifer]
MFTPKQLLIQCISLLCLEHRPGVATSPSTNIITEIVNALPQPEATIDIDSGRQIFTEIYKIVIWLCSLHGPDFPTDTEILQQLRVACREEEYLYEALAIALTETFTDTTEIVKRIHSYRRKLSGYLNEEKIVSILKEYQHKLTFKRSSVADVVTEIAEMGMKLEPYVAARERMNHPAQMGGMDFSDLSALEEQFGAVKDLLSTEGAFRTGWQCLNRMLGKIGAVKRGEFGIVGGLQHQFKSGFMMSLFVHFCLFNKPVMRDVTRKPLIQFISFENEVADNLLWVYKYLKENETGQPVIEDQINVQEASAYVSARLRETGFEVRMDRFDPTEFSAAALTQHLEGLIAEGYEIQMLIVDYLNMLPKTGLEAKVAGDDIRQLFRRVRNFTSPRGITFLTPHQLSSEALLLIRDNVDDFVRNVANKGYYDGCKRLGQEPDLELMIHIVEVNGKKYLTIARGKHRNNVTPSKDQYCVLPFEVIGTIPWDVDGEDRSVAAPGGGRMGTEDEMPWWDAA